MGRRYMPPSRDQSVDDKIRKVYDDINRLADQLASVNDDARRRTDGKEGDLRLVRDKTTDSFELEGRFKEGYVRIGRAEGADVSAIKSTENDGFDIVKEGIPGSAIKIGVLALAVFPGRINGLYVPGIAADITAPATLYVQNIIGGDVFIFTLAVNYIALSGAGIVKVLPKEISSTIHVSSNVYLNS